jgi:hypothetical protein
MEDVHEITQLVLRALVVGGAIAVLLAIGGAVLFHRQLEHRGWLRSVERFWRFKQET